MPIGKDSIKTRVAKAVPASVAAPEMPAGPAKEAVKVESPTEVKPAPKTPAKQKTAPKAEGKASPKKTATKQAPAKKTAPKVETPVIEASTAAPATAVLSNVSPETVAAVVGHEESKPADRVKIGQKLPTHLL